MSNAFVFVGNRFFVLEEMLRLNLNIKKIYAISNTYLEKELVKRKIDHIIVGSKEKLVKVIDAEEFDILVSNGCPYILPVSEFANKSKRFVNIHPSYLPDLRGADPQPGALLFARDSGATCHLMDDKIDTGKIISQVKIPYSDDLDAPLLYQLTFMAEKEVFIQAYQSQFKAASDQNTNGDEIYYSKKEDDLKIDFTSSARGIYQNIKAFSNSSQGAYFFHQGEKYKVFDCEIVTNEYLVSKVYRYQDNEVVFNYENMLLIKKAGCCLKLKCIDKDVSGIFIGAELGS